MDVAQVLAQLGGVATREHLLRHLTEHALRRATTTGAVVRVARGAYALPGTHRASVEATRRHGTVACLSAAEAAGWELARSPDRPWVAVPRHRGRVDARGVHLLFSDERETDPVRIVLQCARHLPPGEALAVADSALRSGQVQPDELVVAAAGLRGPGAGAARRVVGLASASKTNPFESALHALASQVTGLAVVPQLAVVVGGVVVHPDLTDPRLRIVVEADSWLYHAATPDLFDRDVRRYTSLAVEGWLVLRFTHRQVTREAQSVVDTLTAAVRAGRAGVRRPPAR